MYQVVASDLDGTLLSPDHFLTPYAKETLALPPVGSISSSPPAVTTSTSGKSAIISASGRT